MSDLATWLRERLDEDEQVARKAAARRPQIREGLRRWKPDGMSVRDDVGDLVVKHSWPHEIEHIARHDPARVLADVAAKRLQIDMTFRYEATIDDEWGCCHEAESIARGECPAIPVDGIRMLRLLALPYAEHSGYRSEWSPDE